MRVEEVVRRLRERDHKGAAVLICLVPSTDDPDDLDILLEVRAATLSVQPGEVCLPGGRIERGETPAEAAVREAAEELLVPPESIRLVGEVGVETGPGGMALYVFVATIEGYRNTFSRDEVDVMLRLPLSCLLASEPAVYRLDVTQSFPDDFPWDRIPGGRAYPWRTPSREVVFYLGTDPLVWGVTARVLRRFAALLS